MKTIKITPQEYINFRKIAKFKYDAHVSNGKVVIIGDSSCLRLIGF